MLVAVALAARQRTRSEFRRFQDVVRLSAAANTSGDSERVAALLTSRCCAPDALRAATSALSPHEVLVVADVPVTQLRNPARRSALLVNCGSPHK